MSIWDGDTSQPEWEREAEDRADALARRFARESSAETWRGEVHLGGWPEHLAGPEYWLHKRELEDGD